MQEAIQGNAAERPEKPKKVALIDAKIHIFAPMGEVKYYIAMIAGVDFAFKGPTPMAAHSRAAGFQKTQWERITSKRARAEHAKNKAEAQQVAP